MQRRRFLLNTTAFAAAGLSTPAIFAQSKWPAKPIRFTVPFPPGGGTDTVSRLIATKFNTALGWTMVVDNRPGAAGNIGLDAVAKSAPDGYSIGMGQASNLAINPALYANMPFDSLKDFTPIAPISEQPVVLVVKSDSPYKTLADFIKDAKAKPGALSIGQAGNGTVGHLAGELLARAADIKVMQVPYKGAGPAINDLLGGQIDTYFASSVSIMSSVQNGKMRALCVSSAKRLPALPQVPTVAEQGFPGFSAVTWLGLVGPAKIPKDIVTRINQEAMKLLATPDVQERLTQEGSFPTPGTPEQFAQMIQKEHAKWGKLIREAGIKLE